MFVLLTASFEKVLSQTLQYTSLCLAGVTTGTAVDVVDTVFISGRTSLAGTDVFTEAVFISGRTSLDGTEVDTGAVLISAFISDTGADVTGGGAISDFI